MSNPQVISSHHSLFQYVSILTWWVTMTVPICFHTNTIYGHVLHDLVVPPWLGGDLHSQVTKAASCRAARAAFNAAGRPGVALARARQAKAWTLAMGSWGSGTPLTDLLKLDTFGCFWVCLKVEIHQNYPTFIGLWMKMDSWRVDPLGHFWFWLIFNHPKTFWKQYMRIMCKLWRFFWVMWAVLRWSFQQKLPFPLVIFQAQSGFQVGFQGSICSEKQLKLPKNTGWFAESWGYP